jgi:hypothetical protein
MLCLRAAGVPVSDDEAVRLQRPESRREQGSRPAHALDLYTIVGMMTEDEYEAARKLAQDHAGDVHVQKAREIVREDFASATSLGIVRLREHLLFRPVFLVQEYLDTLKDAFRA